jgi:4-amino-4-deoxy-L-arabinose transferase-like glycosyltransferase
VARQASTPHAGSDSQRPGAGGAPLADDAAPGRRPEIALVAGLTAVGLGLRLWGLGQALYGDELFTHHIVTNSSFGDVLTMGGPAEREATPPLFFVLSWLTSRLGDPLVSARWPSLLLGTATVPLVYLLGRSTVGRPAALLGAALMALSPFAIFYSTEARGYAALLFLTALSTLALVAALGTGRRRWWLVFALASVAALYTHYTAVFAIAIQVAWAVATHREQLRQLALACGLIVLLFLPWLPRYPEQSEAAARVEVGVAGRSLVEYLEDLSRLVVGHPFLPLDRLPGTPVLVIGGIVVGIALVAAVSAGGRPSGRRLLGSWLGLLLGLGFALPVGLSLFGLVGKDVYNLKTIVMCLPALCLLLGLAVSRMRGPLRYLALALTAIVLAVNAVGVFDPDNRRPPWNEAAEYIEARARPGDRVLQFDPVWYASNDFVALRSLEIHLDGRRVLFAPDERSASRAARGHRVFFAAGRLPGASQRALRLPEHRLAGAAAFAGFNPVTVFSYAPLDPDTGP